MWCYCVWKKQKGKSLAFRKFSSKEMRKSRPLLYSVGMVIGNMSFCCGASKVVVFNDVILSTWRAFSCFWYIEITFFKCFTLCPWLRLIFIIMSHLKLHFSSQYTLFFALWLGIIVSSSCNLNNTHCFPFPPITS